jgi:hypothetical protein
VRIIPFQKVQRLRIGVLRHTAAGRCNFLPAKLANLPQDDSLESSFLDGGTAGFKACEQYSARDIGVERGHAATLVRYVTLQIFLDGGLAYARGARTEATLRVDYGIVGKQTERV